MRLVLANGLTQLSLAVRREEIWRVTTQGSVAWAWVMGSHGGGVTSFGEKDDDALRLGDIAFELADVLQIVDTVHHMCTIVMRDTRITHS